MKLNLTSVLCSLFLLASSAAATTVSVEAREVQDVAAPQACGDPRLLVPFFRLWQPQITDSFYTTGVVEKNKAITLLGYQDQGIAGYLWPNTTVPVPKQTIPLYRVYNSQLTVTDHFYTTSVAERDAAINKLGFTNEGIAGYVYNDTLCDGLPLYRLYSGKVQNHFYTMDAAERDNMVANDPDGYVYEKIAAYMFRF
ncbi:hypothetical protein CPC08DRAFT_789314 [Agrocybe pediades]|nr:hypothetical protein CPC08DRAFT_789314 [Agrocybe pediades]